MTSPEKVPFLTQLNANDTISNELKIAMRRISREYFTPKNAKSLAALNSIIDLDHHQTISEPLLVAEMIERLKLTRSSRVLEIGTGSGYTASVMAMLAGEVVSIDQYEDFTHTASEKIHTLSSYFNLCPVTCVTGDGSLGYGDLETEKFDAIIVWASSPVVPPNLEAQLTISGAIEIPIGVEYRESTLLHGVNVYNTVIYTEAGGANFVPLIGQNGWKREDYLEVGRAYFAKIGYQQVSDEEVFAGCVFI